MSAASPNDPDLQELLESVEEEYRQEFLEIIALTDAFCDKSLNDEYRDLWRRMTAASCQDGSPVKRGKRDGWACGIAYCVGQVSFLTDPGQTPHMKAEQIAK